MGRHVRRDPLLSIHRCGRFANRPYEEMQTNVIHTSAMSPSMRTTILWLHALGGVAWIGAAAVFVIASSAVGIEDPEGVAMMRRIAPVINRIGLAAMLFIVISGVVNIYIAGTMRRFAFSNAFVEILALKIAALS